jgi:hypothetical protein
MVASEKSQQAPESEIATTVDKDVAKENINMDASDPSQTEKVGTSEYSPKNPQSEIIQAEVIANNVGAEENKNMEDGDGTATSDLVRRETSGHKKNDSKKI